MGGEKPNNMFPIQPQSSSEQFGKSVQTSCTALAIMLSKREKWISKIKKSIPSQNIQHLEKDETEI